MVVTFILNYFDVVLFALHLMVFY